MCYVCVLCIVFVCVVYCVRVILNLQLVAKLGLSGNISSEMPSTPLKFEATWNVDPTFSGSAWSIETSTVSVDAYINKNNNKNN